MGRLHAIEADIADTLKVIEESKTDRSENVGWSTDYVLEVMDNEKWLIGEIAKLREALNFYANVDNYETWHNAYSLTDYIHNVDFDNGCKARKSLEETK